MFFFPLFSRSLPFYCAFIPKLAHRLGISAILVFCLAACVGPGDTESPPAWSSSEQVRSSLPVIGSSASSTQNSAVSSSAISSTIVVVASSSSTPVLSSLSSISSNASSDVSSSAAVSSSSIPLVSSVAPQSSSSLPQSSSSLTQSSSSIVESSSSLAQSSSSTVASSSAQSSSSEPRDPNGGASWGQGGVIGPRTGYPCTGCLFDVPEGYNHDTPTQLLITLHGDEGNPASIHRVYNTQPGFGKQAGFIVASLKCPKALNCDKTGEVAPGNVKADYSWWLWQRFIPEHDPNWVNRQVNKIERDYNIDLSRIYLAGFSGGTTYLSTWGVDNSERYAGMILSAGGGLREVKTRACEESCPLAVVVSTGKDDFLHSNAKDSRDYAERCGHPLLYRETADKGHTYIGKDIREGLEWLLDNPHACVNSP